MRGGRNVVELGGDASGAPLSHQPTVGCLVIRLLANFDGAVTNAESSKLHYSPYWIMMVL